MLCIVFTVFMWKNTLSWWNWHINEQTRAFLKKVMAISRYRISWNQLIIISYALSLKMSLTLPLWLLASSKHFIFKYFFSYLNLFDNQRIGLSRQNHDFDFGFRFTSMGKIPYLYFVPQSACENIYVNAEWENASLGLILTEGKGSRKYSCWSFKARPWMGSHSTWYWMSYQIRYWMGKCECNICRLLLMTR